MEAVNKEVRAIVAKMEENIEGRLGAEEGNEENTENIVSFGPGPVILSPAQLAGSD